MRGVVASLLVLGAAAALTGCDALGTAPSNGIAAIELHPPVLPALTRGDTLRDTTGAPTPLAAIALDGQGDTVPDAPFRFLVLDTGIVDVDSTSGLVTARDTTGEARVIVGAGALQSAPVTVRVTLQPDTLVPLVSRNDTLHFNVIVPADSARALQLRLSHDPTPAIAGDTLVPVPNYLVRFSIIAPADLSGEDTTQVMLVGDGRTPSRVDTTDAQGAASRRILIPRSITSLPPDSVVVEATAFRQAPGRPPVPGSPVRFVVHIVAAGK
jgi:hypothetical protein